MHEAQVIAVAVVLGQRLPVGRAAMLHPARGQLDLPRGGEIARAVDQPGRGPQVLEERDAGRRERREDEAPVARHARGRLEPVLAPVERRVAARIGHAGERAVEVVGPAVVGAGERAGVAALGRAEHRAAVPAAVDEDRDLALAAADHDDRLGADPAGDVVARARDLAGVADEDPPAVEDPLHLVGEDARVGVERRVDAIVLHQRLVVDAGAGLALRRRHPRPPGPGRGTGRPARTARRSRSRSSRPPGCGRRRTARRAAAA